MVSVCARQLRRFTYSASCNDVTDKAFSIAGPRVARAWNALPSDIKLILSRTSFRKKLKTYQFSVSYFFLVFSLLLLFLCILLTLYCTAPPYNFS